jgi:hypothetical protein
MTNNNESRDQARNASASAAWITPRPQIIPRPTYSPAVMALAIVCLLWGLLTSYLISLLGAVLLAVSLAGWIGELRHERQ